MRIRILRRDTPRSEPYWESFTADVTGDMSIASLLDWLNYHDDITNEAGEKTRRIAWDCSCMQGVCGACAMVINGVPALACETFVRDLTGDEISIEPLRKFPVLHDLVVDRDIIQENLKAANIYIGQYRPVKTRNAKAAVAEFEHQYSIAKCLKCGLCLEVCPNYTSGENFFGAMFANDCYLAASRNEAQVNELVDCYGEHFGRGCSNALSCMSVCPIQIPSLSSIAKMNRMHKR